MNIENPVAFSFIMQEDIYLLDADKSLYKSTVPAIVGNTLSEPEPVYNTANATEPVAERKEPVTFKFIGGNKKHYLILTYYPGIDIIDEAHLGALQSTLGRLNTGADDVAIVNMANYPGTGFEPLRSFFNPEKTLFLGKKSVPAGVADLQLNKVSSTEGMRALLTFSFDEMMNSVEHKKAFWEQMKQF
ncbi:hypothetical protein [Mucilaginibacter sp. L3T2-6]|uniref:hypothetical protein n=1 Tax=Mucilaginibacter sp. L3T2-6 TaxID=3062491 RepID=UPI0026773578|nr:hypothetical protein [Mucilaginibacter sp. L3T2-6]MDO3642268.1 hypothetical protein [Mucilaginibacter sp. L3T2-6]MDV6214763.1 hypothetical protein [Mucilaginibacter sp. L3T2-6]